MTQSCAVQRSLDEYDRFASEMDRLDTATDSLQVKISDYLSDGGWYRDYSLVDTLEEAHTLTESERSILTQGFSNLYKVHPECRKVFDKLIGIASENIADSEIKGS